MNTENQAAPEIAYILKGFGRSSETFITNEIYLLEQTGLPLSVFSIRKLTGQQQHGVISRIRAPVTYLPEAAPLSEENFLLWLWRNLPGFLGSHWRLFLRRPVAWLLTLGEALGMCMRYRERFFALPRKVFFKEFLQAGYIALQVLETESIRHLHAHFCHGATTITMLASRMCGVPFSFTAHAKDIYQQDLNPGDLLPRKLKRARFAVTCTGANKTHLDRLRAPDTPLHAIYHGLDLSLFVPSASQPEPQSAPLILSVGRMVEKKGFTYLVEACRILRDQGWQFQCRIVGGIDKYTAQIKRRIEELNLADTVTLHHAVTQEELKEIYARSTLFALPCQVIENGDRDGIPNVLVEAMAMQMPVVSTNISGIPELIEDHINGLLIPQKDAAALAAAIAELLSDPALCQQLGRAARETVCREFDSQTNIQTLRALFDGCLRPQTENATSAPQTAEYILRRQQ